MLFRNKLNLLTTHHKIWSPIWTSKIYFKIIWRNEIAVSKCWLIAAHWILNPIEVLGGRFS